VTTSQLLHEFFDHALALNPNRTAIDVPGSSSRSARRVTYAELDRRARVIADRLAPLTHEGDVVALFIARHDVDLFAAELAVLRIGCAYTCIDPVFPDAHVAFIVEDARARVVLVDHVHVRRAREMNLRADHIVETSTIEPAASSFVERASAPSDLAYLIYTSGTTGRPKGVMIEHRSIVNLIASDIEHFQLSRKDRVAQSSSHAYDSALEETWLAFAVGATVVVLDDETSRLGPDLIPWLATERISVFCPPPTLLRATGCRDPARALPDLKLLYVGGEALPRDIADLWARGRRLENGYGPTECTVTVLRTRIHAHEPITIGAPVPGNHAYVLEGDSEIDDESPGELCIAGIGLARGYLNHPELTAEKFQVHPRLGRIYRTGDRVRRGADGRFEYLGRIDHQVKLRGFRIELTAIEERLAAQTGVRAAACTVQTEPAGPILVAFVVPHESVALDRSAEWRTHLARELPEYMIPARFAVVSALPVTVGGKLDRSKLPRVEIQAVASTDDIAAPRDSIERVVRDAFRQVLGITRGPAIDADFFVELGGDSLRAAEAISLLRNDPSTEHLTVRDLYASRTVRALAALRPPTAQNSAPRSRATHVSTLRVVMANAVQLGVLATTIAIAAVLGWLFGERFVPAITVGLGLPLALVLAPVAFGIALSLYAPLSIAFAVLVKRLLIGKYVETRVPVFSNAYVRHWLVQKAARAIPWNSLQGTTLESSVLRALGAQVGERVHIHRGVALDQGGWDLLEIGDDVTIAQDAALRLVELEDGELVVGPIKIGSSSTVDVRAGMSAHSSLGSRAYLAPLSWLEGGVHVPDGERFDGVPARPAGSAPGDPIADDVRAWSPRTHAFVLVIARAAMRVLFAVPFTLLMALLAWYADLDWNGFARVLSEGSWSALGVTRLAVAACAAIPTTLLLQALLLRALGRVREGHVPCTSPAHVRIALKTDVVQAASVWLSGTLFWPTWLRLAGMRIGRDVEVSTIIDVVPELIEIGEESFLADGIYLGGPRIHRGVVSAALTTLGKRTFLGNHVVVQAGHHMSDDLLIGVCTVSDDSTMRGGTAWFGQPPFELPRRPQTAFDRRVTHDPSFVRRVNRIAWELARFTLPIPAILVGLWAAAWFAERVGENSTWARGALHLGLVACAISASGVLFVLALKWILLGKVRPGQHPLWSCWCSRWDFHYVVWALYARSILSSLEGTSVLAWYLRAMGAKVGKRVVLAGGFGQVVDPDMLEFGDDVTVHALFQAHSFEERVLKIDRVRVRHRADIGPGSVLFYGSDVGEGARVLPHSVVMKLERVHGGKTYVGCPIREVEARSRSTSAR